MGVVYAAFDPELDRRVALKLVLASEIGTGSSQGRTRLLREAQAMAKLTHPNVITVHDVGMMGDRVFVAMEYVHGTTFGEWHKRDTPWAERVRLYLDAAAGLRAAHQAGLVHRDFKPDNVMLGEDGRVRVMDFGIAHAGRGPAERPGTTEPESEFEAATQDRARPDSPDPGVTEAVDGNGARLTRTGAVLGTPAYMSPEQHLGAPTDPRSDQFSWCVSLWEALFGERPFAGNTLAQIALSVSEGTIREPPKDARVPLAVRRVLQRGLAAKPEERWPDMGALMVPLTRAIAPRRVNPMWFAGGLALMGGALSFAYRDRGPNACEAVAAGMQTVWTEGAHERVRGAFTAAAGAKFGGDVAERTLAEIDGWSARWIAERTDACEASRVRREQSDELMDLRMACLDDRLGGLEALLEVFAEPDRATVRKAFDAARALGPLDGCGDGEALRAVVPMPADPARVAEIEVLRDRVRRGKALHDSGRYAQSIETLEGALPEARATNYPPLVARTLIHLGDVLRENGRLEDASEVLGEGYYVAVEHGIEARAASAAMQLAHLTGYKLGKPVQGREWLRAGEAWAKRTGDPQMVAEVARVRAVLLFAEGDYDGAMAEHRASIAATEAHHGAGSPEVGVAYGTLAVLGHAASKLDEAEVAANKAIDLLNATYGPDHPDTASAVQNLGLVEHERGNNKRALELFEETLRVYEATLDPDSPDLAQTLTNIASAQSWLADNEASLASYDRARGIYARTVGDRHPKMGQLLNSVGGVYKEMGRLEDARSAYERSLDIIVESSGPDHPSVAYPLNSLGNLYHQLGEDDRARDTYLEALRILSSTNGPEHLTP
jgi:tetratricopeptide (TPR) repeat protein